MELYWKALPVVIILTGHIPRIEGSVTGILLRVFGYALLGLNVTLADPFADLLLVLTIIIGAITTTYTVHYSRLKYNNLNLVPAVDLFAVSMILVFASKSLIELITFWLLTELVGFFLIAYDYITARSGPALSAAVKYLLFSMIPTDISLFIILALTGFTEAFEVGLKALSPALSHPLISFMVIMGFFAKAAIFPLHFWLPDAHSVAPSPASALLSGLMVKMGVYALYLMSHYPLNVDVVVTAMIVSGGFTVVYGALQAIVQGDIKRLLAYSTTSNTALIILLLGLYMYSKDALFLEASLLYTLTHGVYKASLFLDSGFIETLTHERNVKNLGYIAKISPFETTTVILSVLVMFGLPPSVGFLAKVFLFSSISKYLEKSWIYFLALLIASTKVFLSVIYNVTYLKAHMNSGSGEATEINAKALTMQPYVFTTVSVSFVLTFVLLLLSYSNYVEFILLRKITPVLLASLALFTFILFFAIGLLKRGPIREER
ncbi:MAG: complex I subunit 5 family protein [Desulfurococcaceae archaeon]